MSELILAIDPGETTGYAYGFREGSSFAFCFAGQERWNELALFGVLQSLNPSTLIAESFEFRRKGRDNLVLFSRNLLGVSSLWGGLHDGANLYSQSASEGKGFYTDRRLKKEGYYTVGKEHARDATRHLLYYVRFKTPYTIRSTGG